MKKVMRFSTTLLVLFALTAFTAVNATLAAAQATSNVTVINQTGYDLKPVKFVHEIAKQKGGGAKSCFQRRFSYL